MSLESKIELLTIVIEKLTAVMVATPAPVEQKETPAKAEKPVPVVKTPAPEQPTATHSTAEELKALCMGIVRSDRTKKAAIVAILKDRTIDTIPVSEYAEIENKLSALV
jgi:hypothetical protein